MADELAEESKDMTAFSTPTGHYRFKRMPFGLCNSPLTYMRLMNEVLTGLLGNTAKVFLDDILIASKTAEDHFVNLDLVLSRLRTAGLKVKLEKNVTSYKRKLSTWDTKLTNMA